MSFIWSFEDLSRLCFHKKPIVREWAIERINVLYPEKAGDIAIKLINDKDDLVAQNATEHFLRYPVEPYRDAFLDLYKKTSGTIAGKIANILTKLQDDSLIDAFKEKYITPNKEIDPVGYALSVFAIARLHEAESKKIVETSLNTINDLNEFGTTIAGTLFSANLIAGTDINILLNFCYNQHDNPELIINLLTEIGKYCGSWYHAEDLEEESEKSSLTYMVKESLDYIESRGYSKTKKKIEDLFKKEKYDEIIEELFNETSILLSTKKIEYGENVFESWLKGSGKPRQNISAITTFSNSIKLAPHDFKKFITRTALSVFARLIEYKGLIGIIPDIKNIDTVLRIFLQERGDVEEDERFTKILTNASDKDKIVDLCLKHINENPDSWANLRIVRLLGIIKDINAIAQLFNIQSNYEMLWEEIISAVRNTGQSAIDIVKPVFDNFDKPRIGYALQVLEDLPFDDSVDIILRHWETLWIHHKEYLLNAIRGIGDRRFIELLKKELREGELYEAEVFYLLCLVNKIIDPQLKKAEKEIERYNKKLKNRLNILESSDVSKLLNEPLEIELKCRTCHRSYLYTVKKMMLDPKSLDNYIIDKIKCKNCGVVDHYEITSNGLMSITSRLMFFNMLDEADKDEGVFVVGRVAPVYGKEMSINETLAFYEEKIRDNPENLEYLIGYANTLRRVKRTEDAIPYYKHAIEIDPLTIEAYVSLGQIAEDKDDHKSAYEYYKKASEIIHTGKFYKVVDDIDQFKEMILDNLIYLEKKVGIKPVKFQSFPPVSLKGNEEEILIKPLKVGRNAPCPCGSGKKYKKCCMQKESARKTTAVPVINLKEKSLIEKLISYSNKEKFKKDFLNAMSIYWRTEPVEPLVLPEGALEDKGNFVEWFINDYLLPSGKTIIEDFYSVMFNTLSVEERTILEAHMMSYMSIYEVLEVIEGVGVKIKELFTNRELEIKEIKGSQQLVKWDIIMVRVYTLNGINRFLGSTIQVIPRRLKDSLIAFLTQEFDRYKQETGLAEWSAFMKKKSSIVRHYLEDLSEGKDILLTEERHKIVIAKACFEVKNFEEILDLLKNEYDFVVDKVVKGKEAKLTWLKRGKSKDWQESKERYGKGFVIQSKFIHESGQLKWTVLGSITIKLGSLYLECLSKERLERGKQRLTEILQDLITHKVDTFEDVEKKMDTIKTTEKIKEVEPSENVRSFVETELIKNFKEWPDKKLPALGGMTPREAVKTDTGRQKVFELIKDFENTEERKRKEGNPYLDVNFLKKELGFN
jgi:tetratricopeptide (TPR) repeat protein